MRTFNAICAILCWLCIVFSFSNFKTRSNFSHVFELLVYLFI